MNISKTSLALYDFHKTHGKKPSKAILKISNFENMHEDWDVSQEEKDIEHEKAKEQFDIKKINERKEKIKSLKDYDLIKTLKYLFAIFNPIVENFSGEDFGISYYNKQRRSLPEETLSIIMSVLDNYESDELIGICLYIYNNISDFLKLKKYFPLKQEIGSGMFGQVFKVKNDLALKIYKDDGSFSYKDLAEKLFKTKEESAEQVMVHDHGKLGPYYSWVVMEFLETPWITDQSMKRDLNHIIHDMVTFADFYVDTKSYKNIDEIYNTYINEHLPRTAYNGTTTDILQFQRKLKEYFPELTGNVAKKLLTTIMKEAFSGNADLHAANIGIRDGSFDFVVFDKIY